jgi:hypothetical protein
MIGASGAFCTGGAAEGTTGGGSRRAAAGGPEKVKAAAPEKSALSPSTLHATLIVVRRTIR